MSNPTTLVESFNGSLGAFAGVDPILYDDGLLLQAAGTNELINPDITTASGWVQSGGTATINAISDDGDGSTNSV